MKAFIQRNKNGDFPNINFAIAFDGLYKMGWEIVNYQSLEENPEITKEDLFVGFVHDSKQIMEYLNVENPKINCYPEELNNYYGRRIWKSNLKQFISNENYNIFIKPSESNKLFTGKLIRSFRDLVEIGYHKETVNIWCSEAITIKMECRCFVRYGKILDVRKYKGDWRITPDLKVIENAIDDIDKSLNGYALDFGVTDKGETIVIELNDGFSLGNYGLFSIDYCKLLNARWTQIMKTKDILNN